MAGFPTVNGSWPWLWIVVCVILRLTVLVLYWRVKDGWTNRQTN